MKAVILVAGPQKGKSVTGFLGGTPTSICHFFHLSVHPSIRLSVRLLRTISQELYII